MYLGIDLGTSGAKLVLIDESQTIIASTNAALSILRPHSGWSEQNPADWITATRTALAALRRDHAHAMMQIRGIGLSGQMHGATLLDIADQPLRPSILWNDTRSHAEAAHLDADPQFRDKTGNIVFPGFTAPKLAWVRTYEPKLFDRVSKVLLPKDYLRLWLTGDHISDMSDSAGTSWLDVARRDWDADLLAVTHLGVEHMPNLVEGSHIGGRLRTELAAELGLAGGIPVAGGGGDNAASAIGMGTIASGQAFASLGTSGVLFAANGAYLPNPDSAVHTFCHALPDTWHQMGVILSATDALNWYAKLVGHDAVVLTKELGRKPDGPSSVTFLPYLSGERTPHNDAGIRGIFAGLSHVDDRKTLTAAVLDGVAFAFRDNLEALRSAGTALERVTAIGGGSRSRYWLQCLANALDIPIDCPADGEFGGAFGAARLGLMAAENAEPSAVCTPPETVDTIEPETDKHELYEAAYRRYRAVYPAISNMMGDT